MNGTLEIGQVLLLFYFSPCLVGKSPNKKINTLKPKLFQSSKANSNIKYLTAL